jgi:hypothetical protein
MTRTAAFPQRRLFAEIAESEMHAQRVDLGFDTLRVA